MRTSRLTLIALMLVTLTASMAGQGFKVYPGAKKLVSPDTKESKEAMDALPPGTTIDSYLTDDSFEKVVAFYKGIGKEAPPSFIKKSEKLPNGQQLTRTWFVFDGAADIMTSRSWAMIQHPYVPMDANGTMQYKDARNVTAIVVQQVAQKK